MSANTITINTGELSNSLRRDIADLLTAVGYESTGMLTCRELQLPKRFESTQTNQHWDLEKALLRLGVFATKQAPRTLRGPLYKPFEFKEIERICSEFLEHIEINSSELEAILTKYETLEVARDEVRRCTDLFSSIRENEEYFTFRVRDVASFLPRNQPLYALSCFAIVPSFQSSRVFVRPPEVMKSFFQELIECLHLERFFRNIVVSFSERAEFVRTRSTLTRDKRTGRYEPMTDAVIFTGTMESADLLRKKFDSRTLFIANGAGHNPFVVGENADIAEAVSGAVHVQLYNQGQDCANPSAILVHSFVYEEFLISLRAALKRIKVGKYVEEGVTVGPISEVGDLARVQELLIDNLPWIDHSTPGVIRTSDRIIEPTIIARPLSFGGNYTEQFAPIFFVQQFFDDSELLRYFLSPKYAKNAMYVSLYGMESFRAKLLSLSDDSGRQLHGPETVLLNTHLHAPGVERGTQPYGGYGRGASYYSIHDVVTVRPTLPQRDIYEQIAVPRFRKGAGAVNTSGEGRDGHKSTEN